MCSNKSFILNTCIGSTLNFKEQPSNPTYVVRGEEARLRWKFVCTGLGGCGTELMAVVWHSRNVIFVDFGIINSKMKILPGYFGQFAIVEKIDPTERARYVG